ncbi:major facilitator superfamily transporter [Actinoplanes sp. SE50]|uniref:MFS transporter n=1 Tax=unclassified Actinoplanes TaxID=2626549 RepID=UPI00023EC42F|nr:MULTISPECIES: MFS transporter [unclassified Actinoplanes]AEV83591.1 major facilitator transporter [Actinoplanes sp. SE50/110]ATO82265.1 major facilitator superfamily transporter [Actinoplanes sp. SE50]SLL99672.1 MFS transporter [Actinoplanes sp. SE50/110]
MRDYRDLAALLLTTFVSWFGQRLTAVALPLVALAATGSAGSTGLVAGAAGLPLVTAGWWAGPLRRRVTTGRSLSVTLAAQAAGLLIVPVAALLGRVTVVPLIAGGLFAGVAAAVAGPARQALTADLADRIGPGTAARALAWQDLAHRASMVIAPPLAAAAVAAGHTNALLWSESAGIAVASALLSAVRGDPAPARAATPARVRVPAAASVPAPVPAPEPAASLRAVWRRHPDLRRVLVMSAAAGLVWFAFTLGLTVLGAGSGRPGVLIAAGMTGYGAGSIAGALLAPLLTTRLPALPTAAAGWIILGLAFIAIAAAAGSVPLIAGCAAIGGAVVPFGIAAANTLISTRTAGAERRAAFAAESILHDGSATLGMLLGGPLIALAGPRPTLLAAGLLQIAVALPVLLTARREVTGRGCPPPVTGPA